jgi:hypothetical protein
MVDGGESYQDQYTFGDQDDLLARVVHSRDPIVYLVGSAISRDRANNIGVLDTSEMISEIRSRYSGSTLASLDAKLDRCQQSEQYQTAFQFLLNTRGQNAANELVRDAVLHAYKGGLREEIDSSDHPALAGAERDIYSWKIPQAITRMTEIVRKYRDIHVPIILTSNFDPLIEISLRQQREFAITLATASDNSIDSVSSDGIHVIHYHGYWRGTETLHTNRHIKQRRDNLRASLRDILRRNTVVVLGYGGWDDAFMTSLRDLHASECQNDLLWGFYGGVESKLVNDYQDHVLRPLASRHGLGRCMFYKGVNVHHFFDQLALRLSQHRLAQLKVRTHEEAQRRARNTLDNHDNTAILTYPSSGRTSLLEFLGRSHGGDSKSIRTVCLGPTDLEESNLLFRLGELLNLDFGTLVQVLPADAPNRAPALVDRLFEAIHQAHEGLKELVVLIDNFPTPAAMVVAPWLTTVAEKARGQGIRLTYCIAALRDSHEALESLNTSFPGINVLLMEDTTTSHVRRMVESEYADLQRLAERISYWVGGAWEMASELCVRLRAHPSPKDDPFVIDAMIHEMFVLSLRPSATGRSWPNIVQRIRKHARIIESNLHRGLPDSFRPPTADDADDQERARKQKDIRRQVEAAANARRHETARLLLQLQQGDARNLRSEHEQLFGVRLPPLIPYEFVRIRADLPQRMGFRNPVYDLVASLILQQHLSSAADEFRPPEELQQIDGRRRS